MIIENIRIGGFGKFKNFELKLCKGLQIVYGKNESGKSTIMDFILLMFYSRLSGEKAGKKDKEIRQKYLPWDGGKMFGSIEFIYNNERYLLTKEFHVDTPNKDRVIFRNLSIGEDISLGHKEEVGEWLFDLDLRGFERSGFVKNIGADIFSNTLSKKDSLSDKIFKIVTGQEQENISEGLIIKKLDEAIKDIEKSKGKIDTIENEIYSIKNEIFTLNQKIEIQDNYKNQLKILENRIKSKRDLKEKIEYLNLLEKLNNLKELRSYLRNIENIKASIINEKIEYKDFLLTFDNIKEVKSQIDCKKEALNEFESLNDDICLVSEDDFNVFKDAMLKKQQLKDTVFSINSIGIDKLEENKNLEDEIKNEIECTCKNIESLDKKVSISKFLIGLGGLTGVFLGVILKNVYLIFLLGGLFLIGCFLIYRKINSKVLKSYEELSNLKNTLMELSSKDEKIKKSLEDILLDSNIRCCEDEYGDISELFRDKISEVEGIVNNILKRYNCKSDKDFEILYLKFKNGELSLKKSREMKNEIEILKSKFLLSLQKIFKEEINLNNYDEGCERYNYICGKIEKLKNLENIVSAKSKFINIYKISAGEIDNSIFSISDELRKYNYNDLHIDKNNLLKNLKILEEEKLEEKYYEIKSKIVLIDSDNEDLEIILNYKYDRLSDIKGYLKSLKIAKQVFEESVREIRKDIVPLLDLKSSEIFSKLTDAKYDIIHVQKDYTIFVGDNVSYTSLSSGTIDQAYLSLRIAMSEIISKGSHIPFFMDDILMQYDDYRLKITLKFLSDYFICKEKQSQVIIFTCHDKLLEFAKDLNCNIVYL